MTLALALAASLLWGGSDFVGGTVSRRMAARDVLAISQVIAAFLLAGYVIVTGEWRQANPGVLLALAAGVLWTLGIFSFYQALAAGTMGVVAPIAACAVAVPVVAGLLTGDRPSALQLVGIGLGVTGSVAAAGPELRSGGRAARRARPILLAVLTACCFGVEILLLAHASRTSVPLTLAAMRAASLTCLFVPMVLSRRGLPNVGRTTFAGVILIAFLDLGGTAAFAASTRHGLISLVAVVSSLYGVVTVLLARQVHRERLQKVQTIAVATAFAGVMCIGLGSLGA